MARSVPVEVNPALLRWARESIGLQVEDASRKLGVPPDTLLAWESGEKTPTLAKLIRNAANAYKRPLAVFLLSEVPKDFQVMRDFRRLPNGAPFAPNPRLLFEIRQAAARREDALALARELEIEVPQFPRVRVSLDDNPEEVGATVRRLLGLKQGPPQEWREIHLVLRDWRSRVEGVGGLVFQASKVPLSEMRGFSIAAEQFATIVLNSADSPAGKIFSLLHEFVHVLLRQEGICNFHEDPDVRIEAFCNHSAGAAIVPAAELRKDAVAAVVETDRREPSLDDLSAAAKRFFTSKEVVARRLLTIGHVSERYYQRMREVFVAEYKKIAEEKESFPVPMHFRILGTNGLEFTRLALAAYHQELINSSNLSDLLGMKLNHLGDVEAALNERARA